MPAFAGAPYGSASRECPKRGHPGRKFVGAAARGQIYPIKDRQGAASYGGVRLTQNSGSAIRFAMRALVIVFAIGVGVPAAADPFIQALDQQARDHGGASASRVG